MRITRQQLRKLIREENAKKHPLSDLARKQAGTFGHGEIVDPEEYYGHVQKGIEFTKGRAGSALKEEQETKMKVTESQLRQMIREELQPSLSEKDDPKAKVRNRPDPVFSAGSKFVKDNEDHFPINTKARGENALAQASKYKSLPSWATGLSLTKLVKKIQSAVHSKYPEIEITDASAKPGKG
tara:strand:+ start:1284 stop:1832 length:549 start_codon:yes stop_codon:yes gene_type:complete